MAFAQGFNRAGQENLPLGIYLGHSRMDFILGPENLQGLAAFIIGILFLYPHDTGIIPCLILYEGNLLPYGE
jgi:hypothetical protein